MDHWYGSLSCYKDVLGEDFIARACAGPMGAALTIGAYRPDVLLIDESLVVETIEWMREGNLLSFIPEKVFVISATEEEAEMTKVTAGLKTEVGWIKRDPADIKRKFSA